MTLRSCSLILVVALGASTARAADHRAHSRRPKAAPAPAGDDAAGADAAAPAAGAPIAGAPIAGAPIAGAPIAGAAAAPSGGHELDFDLMGSSTPPRSTSDEANARVVDRKVQLRRSLLVWHQAVGFVTLAGLAAACVIGHLNYDDKYRGSDNGQFYSAHLGLGVGTGTLFATTGILALAAPNPYPKPIKLDSALVHKLAMALATAGMVAQMALGPIVAAREGKLDQRDWALAHLVTGYATFGFMATGVIAYVF